MASNPIYEYDGPEQFGNATAWRFKERETGKPFYTADPGIALSLGGPPNPEPIQREDFQAPQSMVNRTAPDPSGMGGYTPSENLFAGSGGRARRRNSGTEGSGNQPSFGAAMDSMLGIDQGNASADSASDATSDQPASGGPRGRKASQVEEKRRAEASVQQSSAAPDVERVDPSTLVGGEPVAPQPSPDQARARERDNAIAELERQQLNQAIAGKLVGGQRGREAGYDLERAKFKGSPGAADELKNEYTQLAMQQIQGAREEAELRQLEMSEAKQRSIAGAMAAAEEAEQTQTRLALAQQAKQKRLGKLQKTREELDAVRVNPNRFWHDSDAGTVVAAALFQAMGAFSSGLNGGPNHAAEMLDRYIERDTEQQMQDLMAKRGKYNEESELYQAWLASDESPEHFKRELSAVKRMIAAEQANAYASQVEYRRVAPQFKQVAAMLAKESLDSRMAVDKEVGAEFSYTWDEGQAASAARRVPLSASEAQQVLNVSKTAGELRSSGDVTTDENTVYIRNKPFAKVNPKDRDRLTKVAADGDKSIRLMDEYDSLMDKGSTLSRADRSRAEALEMDMFASVKQTVDGMSSDADAEKIKAMVPQGGMDLFNMHDNKARLDVLRARVIRGIESEFGTSGARHSPLSEFYKTGGDK